jgi:hypothetical protein
MPALVDTVASLAMQKVMAERRIAVQSLRDLEEGLPLSSILLRQVAIIVAQVVSVDKLKVQVELFPPEFSQYPILVQRAFFEEVLDE